MKFYKKICALAMSASILGTSLVTVQADGGYQVVQGTEDPGINISLNDLNIINRNANGAAVFPVIINGSTYLPVRGVAAAAGLTVGWNDQTQTVTLTTDTDADIVEATKAFSEPAIDPNTVKYSSINEAENNDDFYAPQVLPTLPVMISGVIDDKDGSKTDSVDWYQFEVSGEGLVRVDVESEIQTNATIALYGYNKDNSTIENSYGNDFSSRSFSSKLEPGTYLVKVSNSGGEGAYTLKIAELPLALQTGDNSEFEKAYPITFGTKLYNYVKTKDSYNAYNYEDYYSFEVKSAHAVTINTVAKDFNNVKLYLYSQSKSNYAIYSDTSDNKTNRFISGVLQPGKYVIKVTGAEGAYYGLLLESLEAASLTSKKVAATVRPDIKIVINGEAFTAKDANGNVIYPVIINGSTYLPVRSVAQAVGLNIGWDGSVRTVIMAKNPTDNLLQNVSNKFADAGSVDEIEDNDEFYSAQEIALVGSVNGKINDDQSGTSDKKDYYKIDVPYEGRITVTAEGASETGNLDLKLSGYNDNNSLIAYDYAEESTSRTVQAYVKAGSYIIQVSGAKAIGTYTLTTSYECPTTQGENNDSFSTATVIDLQSEVDGIIVSRDTTNAQDYDDFYRIVVFDVGTIQIKVTSDRTVNAGVYLYSSLKPNSALANNTSAVESERTISQAVQPGVYYIKIVHNGDPGMYHLSTSFTK